MAGPPHPTHRFPYMVSYPTHFPFTMTTTASTLAENYQVSISNGRHTLLADEPFHAGGGDTGPNPYDLLLASLAACTAITVQMYAQRKQWPLERVNLSLSRRQVLAKDCPDCTSDPNSKVEMITVEVSFEGNLTSEQIDRLLDISGRCPVHRSLIGEIKINTQLAAKNNG